MNKFITNVQGFTLIELLVVIGIIAVLSSLAVASLNEARAAARYVQVLSDMKQIAKAAELDYYDYGDYAPPGGGPVNGGPTGTPPGLFLHFLLKCPPLPPFIRHIHL